MIKPLTSLRFIAALAVFGSHLSILQINEKYSSFYNRILYEGYLGVTFFFMLSGFILTYNYHSKFKVLDSHSLKKFYFARFTRIYPVYLLTFLIAVPIVWNDYILDPIKMIYTAFANLTMVHSFIPIFTVYFSYNAPSWSISDEMFFYVLFPFVIYISLKIMKSSSIYIPLFIAVIIYVLYFYFVWQYKDVDKAHWLFYISPFTRLGDFLIGVFIGMCFIRKKEINLSYKVFSFLEISSILLLFVPFYYFMEIHQSLRFGVYYTPFFAIIIFIFAFQKGFISRLISSKRLIYLGEISFSFYMVHLSIINYLSKITYLYERPIVFVLVALLSSIMLSHVIYKYYELPTRNKLRNWSKQHNSLQQVT